MAYEVHLIRPNDEISIEDWKQHITKNPKLEAITEVNTANPNTVEVITIKMPYSARYDDRDANITLFLRYSKGQIHVKIGGEADIQALRPIANALSAVIEGDEGKRY